MVTPRTAVMQGHGDAAHSLHAGAGGCPAQPSCRGWGVPYTTCMHGQFCDPYRLHAGAGGHPAQPSCRVGYAPHNLNAGSLWRCHAQPSCRGMINVDEEFRRVMMQLDVRGEEEEGGGSIAADSLGARGGVYITHGLYTSCADVSQSLCQKS